MKESFGLFDQKGPRDKSPTNFEKPQRLMIVSLDDDYLTSNSKEFICFSLGLSGSESLHIIFLAHLWDFLFKFF